MIPPSRPSKAQPKRRTRPSPTRLIEIRANELAQLEKRLASLERDALRLDTLEREVNEEPLLLHSLPFGTNIKGFRGLGLACTERSLRQAIDDLSSLSRIKKAKARGG